MPGRNKIEDSAHRAGVCRTVSRSPPQIPYCIPYCRVMRGSAGAVRWLRKRRCLAVAGTSNDQAQPSLWGTELRRVRDRKRNGVSKPVFQNLKKIGDRGA